MKKRVGILTAGGDCPGLNATIRGVAKALYVRMGENVEIIGILNGYHGLINGDYKKMQPDDFRGLLTLGGTILGTKRTPFKMMQVIEEDKIDKVAAMKKTYNDLKLDCLLCLGGNGTHKTANLLSKEGLNIIGLPKTIDNDIYGTDVTFGFHTAVDIATDVIDRIHTTAGSHSRVMCIEIMGNKAGWLTLYAGIAGGADIILLPELPYDIDRVCAAVERRAKNGSNFSIIAVAEGALNAEEARMKRKEWTARRAKNGDDRTEESVLKMIYMYGRSQKEDFASYMSKLNIVPVSINYEFDPNDFEKAHELDEKARNNGVYHKGEFEDIKSIVKGIKGYKGHVTIVAGQPITEGFSSPEELAQLIDDFIYQHYELFPSVLIAAHELGLATADEVADITAEEKQKFLERVHAYPQQLQERVLKMYAYPYINQKASLAGTKRHLEPKDAAA